MLLGNASSEYNTVHMLQKNILHRGIGKNMLHTTSKKLRAISLHREACVGPGWKLREAKHGHPVRVEAEERGAYAHEVEKEAHAGHVGHLRNNWFIIKYLCLVRIQRTSQSGGETLTR